MADKKISELPVLTNAAANDADIVPIVDVSSGITSKITLAELLLRFQGNDGPAGPTGATGATGPQGASGIGVINGGTANQALTKIDGADGNTQWSTIDKTFVGLGNVDNTSDANKPISTATQTALNAKADSSALTAHTGATTGVHGVTGAVVGTTDTQSVSNKTITASDIDGGTASNTSRITIPKATKTTLDAITRKEATLLYASDQSKLFVDDGVNLKEVGSGAGGSVNFIANGDGSSGTTGWTTYTNTASSRPTTGA